MEVLAFTVINKEIECDIKQVVGDNDYQASFILDDEWNDKEVICRVVWNNRTSLDIVLEDLSCVIPAYIMKRGEVSIGVYAEGDEQLTTEPWLLSVRKSIREKEFETAMPHKEIWNEINEKIKNVITSNDLDEKVVLSVNDAIEKSGFVNNDELSTEVSTQVNAYFTENNNVYNTETITDLKDTGKNFNASTGELQTSAYANGVTDYIAVLSGDKVVISAFAIGNESIVTAVGYDTDKNVVRMYYPGTLGLTIDNTTKFQKDVTITISDENIKYIRVVSWKNDLITWDFYVKKISKNLRIITSENISEFIPSYKSADRVDFTVKVYRDFDDTEYEDNAVLFLPKSYSANGEPTRLIIHCHGSGRVIDSDLTIGTIQYLPIFYHNGYAILDVNGGIDGGRHYGADFAIQSYVKAYKYAITHYNLYKEVFVLGASMGGLASTTLVQSGLIPVIAQGLFCPVVDLYKQAWQNPWYSESSDYSVQRKNIALYYGFDNCDTFADWTTSQYPSASEKQYFLDNIQKVSGYNPIFTKSLGNENISVAYEATNGSDEEKVAYNNMQKLYPVPLNIIVADSDSTVKPRYSKYFAEMLQNGGCIVNYKTYSSSLHTPMWGDVNTLACKDGESISIYENMLDMLKWFDKWN